MNKLTFTLAVCLGLIFNLHAGPIEIKVVFNNTTDIDADLISKIQTAVNVADLSNSMEQNFAISDKTLRIRIAFYDRWQIGAFKTKQQNEFAPDDYITKWSALNENLTSVLFLFEKDKDSPTYKFYRMTVSPQLEAEYLLPLISEFINQNLQGDPVSIITDGTKYLARALVPVWTEEKKSLAQQLIDNNSKYLPGHVNYFHGWFKFGFFNLRPAKKDDTQQMKLVNCWQDKNLSDKEWFFSNKYIFTSDQNLENYSKQNVYDWSISFEKDNISGIYIFKDAFLFKILSYIEGTKKHHLTSIASEWPWVYSKDKSPSRYVSDFNSFKDRDSTDRLILFFDESLNIAEGEAMPKLCGSSENTWCNVFACDLSNQVLFGEIFGDVHNGPWGAHNCANALHYRISNDRKNFKEVPLSDAWKYTLKGFVVYLSTFHHSVSPDFVVQGVPPETGLCQQRSGHIATCYPEKDKIIQAGSQCGLLDYSEVFTSTYNGKVKASIYLGYLK